MVAVASIFFSSDIMQLLYHKAQIYNLDSGKYVQEYEVVFACLMASFPAWCLMYVYSTLLTANGSLRTLNMVAFAGVLINLPLNFMLIGYFDAEGHGAYGGAITSCLTQWILALTFMVYAIRILKLPVNVKWVLAHIGYLAVVVALAYEVLMWLHMNWFVQISALMLISVGLLFVFRFVTFASLKKLAPSKE